MLGGMPGNGALFGMALCSHETAGVAVLFNFKLGRFEWVNNFNSCSWLASEMDREKNGAQPLD